MEKKRAPKMTALFERFMAWRRGNKPAPKSRIVVANHNVPPDIQIIHKGHPNKHYKKNNMKTTKYTILTFLPKNLYEQLHRFANIFFLFILFLNWIPQINAFAKEVAMLPVLFVLSVTAIKDAYEDYRRYCSDKKINNFKARTFSRKEDKYTICKWQDILAGDIVHLSCNEVIPADILLLHSSDETGVCFIETSNLDGESNLKQRQVVTGLREKTSFHPLDFKADIECETPNTELYKFNGSLVHPNGERTGINKDNLLLRGCTLRNTDYVEGIVVYAGHETKALLNNRGPRHKRSKLERQINKDVIWCVVLLAIMCFAGGIGHGLWFGSYSNPLDVVFLEIYKKEDGEAGYQGFLVFWTHLITLQVMIPLPMYVTIEIVKLAQTLVINQDIELYHEPSNKRMECRALNITEDLGQIQYLFSDKTGTLTENRMVFRTCSVGGEDYSHVGGKDPLLQDASEGKRFPRKTMEVDVDGDENDEDEDEFIMDERLLEEVAKMTLQMTGSGDAMAKQIQDFFILMTICNTVVVSSQPHGDKSGVTKTSNNKNGSQENSPKQKHTNVENKPGKSSELVETSSYITDDTGTGSDSEEEMEEIRLCYEAESPDELALVKAAYRYGCRLIRRSPDRVTIWLPAEGEVTFQILHILEFDSDRKRMSVIVKYPNTDEIVLLCKGADSSIINNLEYKKDDFDWQTMLQCTRDHVNQYAKNGLRTLCMAKKTLSASEYQKWSMMRKEADCAIENKEELITKAALQIESDLTLLGATGIEDNLQEGVPETINSLRKAGINVWVLTGDKQETALNIAFSCKLMEPYQHIITLNATKKEDAEKMIRDHLKIVTSSRQPGPNVEVRQRHRRPAIKKDFALVIDGFTLAYALDPTMEKSFLSLAEQCSSVLCCRATPIQKAAVVKLVKEHLKMATCAIGDGANDVSMIQTADIGIGISGQEGMQAVMASDFAIARFHYLERLLLVHGHWCYDRLARMSLYMFYKSAAFVFLLFLYNLYNGFSSSIAVDQYYTILHNLVFTSLPPVIFGIFDQDLPDKVLLAKPHLYRSGQSCKSYLPHSFWVNVIDGLWQSMTVFFTCYWMYLGSSVGMAEFGTTAISATVFLAIGVIGIETKSFMWFTWFVYIASILATFIIMGTFNEIAITIDPPLNPVGVSAVVWSSPLYWLSHMLILSVALLPRLCIRCLKGSFDPSYINIARQLEQGDTMGSFYGRSESKTSLRKLTASSASLGSQASDMRSQPSLRSRRKSSAHRLTTHVVTHSVSRSMPYLNASDSRPSSGKNRSRPSSGRKVGSTQSTPSHSHRRQKSQPLTSSEMSRMSMTLMTESIHV